MNTTLISLSFILFLSALTTAQPNAAGAVLDIDGNHVQAGLNYYILPVFRGRGGGLTLSAVGNNTCPLAVVQEPLEVRRGRPVTFSSVDNQRQIRVSVDNNIRFSGVPSAVCRQSKVWKLNAYDESVGKYFVTTGGVAGNPGPATISNWFKIEVQGSDYKLVFCPTVCNFCKVICRDVGIFVEDGQRRLALTDGVPFSVSFKKA